MSDAIVLTNEKNKLFSALTGFAAALSSITPEEMPAAFEVADQLLAVSDEVRGRIRERLLQRVQQEGEQVTEKGSMRMGISGYRVSAIPTKTGTDPKKLEALLRRLGQDPTLAMDAKVTYSVNDAKLLKAVSDGKLTAEDVASCKYTPAFRLDVTRE